MAEQQFRIDVSDKCFDKYGVPDHLRDGIKRYLVDRVQPGSCLQAVLENDLQEAVSRADDVTFAALPSVVKYLFNEAPIEAYGEKGCVSKWLQGKGVIRAK